MNDTERYLAGMEAREAIDRAALGQGELVRRLVSPFLDTIHADLTRMREEIDGGLENRGQGAEAVGGPGVESGHRYPLGWCKPIRDLGLAKLTRPSDLIETDGTHPSRESAHSQSDLVGRLVQTDGYHPFGSHH